MEINKSLTKTISADIAVNLKWILSEAEPTAPEGFERVPEFDIDIGIAGKWWAFIQAT